MDADLSLQGLRVLRTLLDSVEPLPGVPLIREFHFTALATWTVNHGAGFRPLVLILDSSGYRIVPTRERWLDLNTFVATFSSPQTGTVYVFG